MLWRGPLCPSRLQFPLIQSGGTIGSVLVEITVLLIKGTFCVLWRCEMVLWGQELLWFGWDVAAMPGLLDGVPDLETGLSQAVYLQSDLRTFWDKTGKLRIAVGPAGDTECPSELWGPRRLVWLSSDWFSLSCGRSGLKDLACSEPRLSLFLSQMTNAPTDLPWLEMQEDVGLCGKCPRRPLGWAEGMWCWHHL